METVEEMIKAVDDGDGELEYDEFINLLKKWNPLPTTHTY